MSVEERDPHTGYLTTGHEWSGITELNRPVPRPVWLFLTAAFLFSVGYWILMPAWPLVDTYTKGLLGVDQRADVSAALDRAAAARSVWTERIQTLDFDRIAADDDLMRRVRLSGPALFEDNCAACHGVRGEGGPGYPSLTDRAWLWGDAPEAIAETLRVGINSSHEESRVAQMLGFGKDQILDRAEVLDVVAYVRSLSGASERPVAGETLRRGATLFEENCEACHGPDAAGNHEVGAPDLTDAFWIYGGDRQSVYASVYGGREGQMPSWEGRLSDLQRKVLTLYILDMGEAKP